MAAYLKEEVCGKVSTSSRVSIAWSQMRKQTFVLTKAKPSTAIYLYHKRILQSNRELTSNGFFQTLHSTILPQMLCIQWYLIGRLILHICFQKMGGFVFVWLGRKDLKWSKWAQVTDNLWHETRRVIIAGWKETNREWIVSVKGRLEGKQLRTNHIKMLMNPLFCMLAFNPDTELSLTLSQISTVLSTWWLRKQRAKHWILGLRHSKNERKCETIYLKDFLQVFHEVIKIVLSHPTPSPSLFSSGHFVFVSSHFFILIWPPNLLLKHGCYGTRIHYFDQVGTLCIVVQLLSHVENTSVKPRGKIHYKNKGWVMHSWLTS